MKTVKEWLEELPEPFREHALKNAMPDALNFTSSAIYNALNMSFVFDESPEGAPFWCQVWNSLVDGIGLPDPYPSWKPAQLNGIDL